MERPRVLRPQLRRDSLGCATRSIMKHALVATVLALSPVPLRAQGQDPAGPVRVVDQPEYRAPDGSVSRIAKGQLSSPFGALHLLPSHGAFTLTFVSDDADECVAHHSVEHGIRGDTLTVTLFDNAPALCPGLVTLREYTLSVTNLDSRHYLLQVYFEGRGGRGGRASGARPRYTLDVYAQ